MNNHIIVKAAIKIALFIGLLFFGMFLLLGGHTVLAALFYFAGLYVIFAKSIPGLSSKRPVEPDPTEPSYDPAEHGTPMACPFCGKKIQSDNNFCFYCGKSLESYKRIDAARVKWLDRLDDALEEINRGTSTRECMESAVKIRDLTDKILTRYAKDPEDRDDYDRFIDYYLPKTAAAVEQYGILCTLDSLDREQTSAKQQLGNSINLLDDAFTSIYNRLSTEGLFDISTDITAVENILKLEGLTDSDFPGRTIP